MDRTSGQNHVVVSGKRKFTDGPPGTTVDDEWLNSIQEEIMSVIEGAGITPSTSDLTQLYQAVSSLISTGGFFRVPAIGMSVGDGGLGDYVSSGDVTMDGEYHYDSFNLQAAHKITIGSTGILIIRCKASAIINGSIDANGSNGVIGSIARGGAGGGGVGGGGGGATYESGSAVSAVTGGSGGGIYSNGALGGYGGLIAAGSNGSAKINPLLYIMHRGIMGGSGGSAASNIGAVGAGGSPGGSISSATEWTICSLLNHGVIPAGGGGGGGGAGTMVSMGGGGGGGGGVIIIVSPRITGSGEIFAKGGDGSPGFGGTGGGGGGGGGGGVIILVSRNNPSSITISADGGAGGAPTGAAIAGSSGVNGFTKKYYSS